jgi:type II secretion system protein I
MKCKPMRVGNAKLGSQSLVGPAVLSGPFRSIKPSKVSRPAEDSRPYQANRGFTLIELLAAMTFMAIVIPVTMHALAISNRAGQVAQRKAIAARVADRALNEYVANSRNLLSSQKGVAQEGAFDFNWNIRMETWREDNMRLVTCEVTYPVQGEEYSVTASTLISITTR